MSATLGRAFLHNFLGQAPAWNKYTIIAFLAVNPLIHLTLGPVVAGWLLLAQFIFTLAMALKCYPLQPGGLLAIEAVLIGLTSAETVLHKVESNLEAMLLLIFTVCGGRVATASPQPGCRPGTTRIGVIPESVPLPGRSSCRCHPPAGMKPATTEPSLTKAACLA